MTGFFLYNLHYSHRLCLSHTPLNPASFTRPLFSITPPHWHFPFFLIFFSFSRSIMSAQSDIAGLVFWSLCSNPLQMWTRIWHKIEEKKKKALLWTVYYWGKRVCESKWWCVVRIIQNNGDIVSENSCPCGFFYPMWWALEMKLASVVL